MVMDDEIGRLLPQIMEVRHQIRSLQETNYMEQLFALKQHEADLIVLLYKALEKEGLNTLS